MANSSMKLALAAVIVAVIVLAFFGTGNSDVSKTEADPGYGWTSEPVANALTYNGLQQELVTAGVSEGGTALYRLGDGEYSSNIPTASEVGKYDVYYKIQGDSERPDSKELSVEVTILPEKWDGVTVDDVPVVDDTYYIYTSAQLAGLVKLVDEGGFSGRAVLMHDLDLSSYNWVPIGSLNHHFEGTFDGNGHTISNLLLSDDSATYAGLFGYVGSGTISNVTIRGFEIHGSDHVAVLAGYLGAEAENIRITGIDNERTVSGNRFVGGLAGVIANDVTGCTVENAEIVCGEIGDAGSVDNQYGLKGDKAGVLAGYAADGVTVSNVTLADSHITAYRDAGALVGCCVGDIYLVNVTFQNIRIDIDHDGTSNEFNVHEEVGFCESLTESGIVGASSIEIHWEHDVPDTGPESPTVDPALTGVVAPIVIATPGYDPSEPVVIRFDGATITGTDTPAIDIADGFNVTLIISGNCVFTGGIDCDGIRVASGATLTITGEGSLTVIGNNGYEYVQDYPVYSNTADASYKDKNGSGIGYVGHTPGAIRIDSLSRLVAEGYGLFAYGIGGYGGSVTIVNSGIEEVKGGCPRSEFTIGSNGKNDMAGGPAIGGATIHIYDSELGDIIGGSKSAAIGETFHRSTSIVIVDTEIANAVGGSSSAGIGGSRFEQYNKDMCIVIYIESSVIKATGGDGGAGIGSGYDVYCACSETDIGGGVKQKVYEGQGSLRLDIVSYSVIDATAGKYAANIGTGFHHAIMTGHIDGTVDLSKTYEHTRDTETKKLDAYYSDSYSYAQIIGYGVVDPAREGLVIAEPAGDGVYALSGSGFTVAGNPVDTPEVKTFNHAETGQNLAYNESRLPAAE